MDQWKTRVPGPVFNRPTQEVVRLNVLLWLPDVTVGSDTEVHGPSCPAVVMLVGVVLNVRPGENDRSAEVTQVTSTGSADAVDARASAQATAAAPPSAARAMLVVNGFMVSLSTCVDGGVEATGILASPSPPVKRKPADR